MPDALTGEEAATDFGEVRRTESHGTAIDNAADAQAGEPEAETEVASPPPEPTEPVEDLSAAEAACRAGDLGACLRAANRYAEGLFGEERDETKARALWQRACERKHPEACRRLALRILTDDDRADERRAVRLLDESCELGSLVACAALGDLYRRGERVPADVYKSLLHFQRACNGGYAGACVAMQSTGRLAEPFDLPLPRPRLPPVPARPPAAETACPAALYRTAAGEGEPIDGGLRPLPTAALVDALGSLAADRTCAAAPGPTAGDPTARATCPAADATVDVVVSDRYRECTLQPGTGAAMLAAQGRGERAPTALRVGRVDAVVEETNASVRIRLWLADRCTVVLTAVGGTTAEELRATAAGFDLRALEKVCAWREGEGLPDEWGRGGATGGRAPHPADREPS